MICNHCHRNNRKEAKFCKWCGHSLSLAGSLDDIVGMDDVKRQLRAISDSFTYLKQRKELSDVHLSVNTVIIGETGTGKTLLARSMCDYFYEHGIIKKRQITIVDAVSFGRFVDKWDENIKKAQQGILFFDNVQKLLPDKYSTQVNPLDKLFADMDSFSEGPAVVMAGLPKGLEDFLESNPSVSNRFRYIFRLPEPGLNELLLICRQILSNKYGITNFTPGAEDRLRRYFLYQLKKRDDTFGYGHVAAKEAEGVFTSYISHAAENSFVDADDIPGFIPEEHSTEQILQELDSFVGMDGVKKAVRDIAAQVKSSVEKQQRGLDVKEKMALHIVLTGNPGTGKTTVARKLGEMLAAIGYLDSGHVVEVDRAKMISPYQGETPRVVDSLVNKAMGGILFIDEAYTLAPQNDAGTRDQQGEQVIEKLMKRMEDDRGRFVVIAAGYRTEMENLFRMNPGFRSRFTYFINIDDYTPQQLCQILFSMAKERHLTFTPEAKAKAEKCVLAMYESRDKTFANGRAMRQLLDNIITRQAERLQKDGMSQVSNDELLTIQPLDIPFEEREAADYHKALEKLNTLVGLPAVKKEITSLAATINLQIRRGESGAISGRHYVFTGNPGTGKTTVARIMADILFQLGVVSKGQLIEADRSKFVAGFSGQTAIKTNHLVDEAMGGVLFIDEAYSLRQNDNDIFGSEAINTLLKRMEDDRGRFVVIAAGYTDEMHDFIDSNPGLKSRFTNVIHFDDYTADELTQIFVNLAQEKHFTIADDTHRAIQEIMEEAILRKDKNFGNARVARKLFEQTVERQSRRLMTLLEKGNVSQEDMYALMPDDLPRQEKNKVKPLEEVLKEMDQLVGMRSVKNAIRRIAVQQMFLKQRQTIGVGSAKLITMNFVLTGNPGTGKTTIARMMGELLHSMGVLPTSKVIEATRASLVGRYMGETPKIVNNMVDKALGGILFIDEAYTLMGDQYGQEAIDTLMKRMEDDRGKLVVIVAGYKNRMDNFLTTNPGLASRFTHSLHIDDYNEDELLAIFKQMAAKENYHLTMETEMKLMGKICAVVMKKDDNFGNARWVRNLLDQTIQQLSVRLSKIPPDRLTKEAYQTIKPEDIL